MSHNTLSPDILSAREILARLISFKTVSRNSNLELIDWVEAYLASHGVAATRVYDETQTKAALYAHVGPWVAGGVILSGHSDVVPVDGQAWTRSPFVLEEEGGKIYGRGACDMKGFLALALAAVPFAKTHPLARPLQIAISYDEEVGCIGARPMIAEMAQHLPRAAAVVVGEPSMMRMVNGHKGGIGFAVHVQGYEVHSSLLDRGVNAIMRAAPLIDWANHINAQNAAQAPNALVAMFDPPYTTAHVGVISGGTAHNITAKDCHFGFDFRVVPGETPAQWVAALNAKVATLRVPMQALRPETDIILTQRFDVPPLTPEQGGAAEALVRRLTGDNGVAVVSYGTEAGQFQEMGYSTVVCGPGDIAQAHQPDEFILSSQFDAGWTFMMRLLDDLAQPAPV